MKAFRDWDLACKINAAILLFLLVAGGLIGGVLYWKTRQILSEEVDTSGGTDQPGFSGCRGGGAGAGALHRTAAPG